MEEVAWFLLSKTGDEHPLSYKSEASAFRVLYLPCGMNPISTSCDVFGASTNLELLSTFDWLAISYHFRYFASPARYLQIIERHYNSSARECILSPNALRAALFATSARIRSSSSWRTFATLSSKRLLSKTRFLLTRIVSPNLNKAWRVSNIDFKSHHTGQAEFLMNEYTNHPTCLSFSKRSFLDLSASTLTCRIWSKRCAVLDDFKNFPSEVGCGVWHLPFVSVRKPLKTFQRHSVVTPSSALRRS